ncbi:MAG TPA: TolC family protein [Vicinamibacterales bacterium]
MTRVAGYGVAASLVLALLPAGVPVASAQTPLTLEEAMQRARGASGEARALASAVGEADARVQRARAGYWPRIDLAESVQRGNHPVFAFSSLLSQRRFTAQNFAIASLNHPDPVTNTRTTIGVEQAIFDGGTTTLGIEGAKLGRDAAAAAQDAGGQDLAFRAARAFVRVLQLEATLRAADAAVAVAESDQQRARARRDVGVVTEADVLAVDVHLADMQQRQIAAGANLGVARIELAEAVGAPLTEPFALAAPATRGVPTDVDALVQDALASHPLRRSADLQVQLADNARRTARAALWPTAGVEGGWEFNGASFGQQRSSWIVGAEVRINVFRGFADSARRTEADHGYTRATAEHERVLRRIEVDIRTALAQHAAARAREAAGRMALIQARESQRIIRDRYESGLATVTDVLRAAEAALDAESRATEAAMDAILQSVAIDRALGRL